MQRQLDASASSPSSSGSWAESESVRISKETRKVLRLAGWDLRERFRSALDKAREEEDEAKRSQKAARDALDWLERFQGKIEQLGGQVEVVDTSVEWR